MSGILKPCTRKEVIDHFFRDTFPDLSPMPHCIETADAIARMRCGNDRVHWFSDVVTFWLITGSSFKSSQLSIEEANSIKVDTDTDWTQIHHGHNDIGHVVERIGDPALVNNETRKAIMNLAASTAIDWDAFRPIVVHFTYGGFSQFADGTHRTIALLLKEKGRFPLPCYLVENELPPGASIPLRGL